MHSLSPNRRLHRHRSWRRKDPPLVKPEFTIQFHYAVHTQVTWSELVVYISFVFATGETSFTKKSTRIPPITGITMLWTLCVLLQKVGSTVACSSVLNALQSPSDCYCLYRHSSAEWRHWVSACPVAVWGRQQKDVPAPSRRIHSTYISIIWWAVVLHLSFRQQ